MAINPIIAMTLGYAGVVLLAFLVINFLTAGFLRVYLVIKGSRGKKILTNVYAINRNYARPGEVDNGFYIYTDGNKHEKRLKIPKDINVFYRFLNVTWVNVDEQKNVFISPEGKEVAGFDAESYNNLYKRTLYRPTTMDSRQQFQFFLIIGIFVLSLITLIVLAAIVLKKINYLVMATDQLNAYFVTMNSTIG